MGSIFTGHEAAPDGILKNVFYEGTDELLQGEPLCYNTDFGTATAANARRGNRVERPSLTNHLSFAGVAVATTKAQTSGRMIEIYEPGSLSVPVALNVDTVIDTGLLTFVTRGRHDVGTEAGLGGDARFALGQFPGRGSAIPRQTVTTLIEGDLLGSAWSLAADGLTLTMTSTTGLAAGDFVVLYGGQDDATGAVIPGRYLIASITSATVLVLTAPSTGATAVDATTTALTCIGVAFTGNPTAICDLLTGDESGGVEFLNMPDAGGDSQPHMAGAGYTYVQGGITLAADCEVELAQGTQIGQRRGFELLHTLTTSDFVIDLVTAGVQYTNADATALAEVNAIDAAGEGAILEFRGQEWYTISLLGAAAEA